MKGKLIPASSKVLALGAGAATFFAAASAFAAEGAASSGGGGLGALLPPPGELIPTALAFIVLFLIMWKFALPGVVDSLDQRAATIRESLEKADEARIEAERLLADYKEQLAAARKEAQALLAEAKTAAESIRSEAQAKATAEGEALIDKARQAIEGEKRAAVAELQKSVADLSVSVAGKLIGSELSKEDHLEVIEKYLDESGSLNAN